MLFRSEKNRGERRYKFRDSLWSYQNRARFSRTCMTMAMFFRIMRVMRFCFSDYVGYRIIINLFCSEKKNASRGSLYWSLQGLQLNRKLRGKMAKIQGLKTLSIYLISIYLIIIGVAGASPKLRRSSFPKGFKFGASSSAYQVPLLSLVPSTNSFIGLSGPVAFLFHW